jgi:membrane-bound ClpP family serine protease
MFFGLLLIVIGVIFLLQNLGYLSASAWGVLWPVIVVIIGLTFIFGRSRTWWWYHMQEKKNRNDQENSKL